MAKKQFLDQAATVAFDETHRDKLEFNIGKYLATVEKGKRQYTDLEAARRKAKNLKWKTVASLDTYLLEFERNFTRNGGKVVWAPEGSAAVREILSIIRQHNGQRVVKSKSMATEEIGLNEALEAEGIEVQETDLGEYIVQLAGEKPYHIVTPAMHKSKEDVAALFHDKIGTDEHATPEQLTLAAREVLREKYVQADIGITGANFIIADAGAVAVTENEGNARLSTAFPRVHIVLVGIEKVIPSLTDLGLFWPLLATYGTGQNVTVYNTVFTGPKKESEADGPEHMYVVLLDNGRSGILADPVLREAMYCIRCGACLNVCPVYKSIGGHAYQTTYSGPIGSVITPHLRGFYEYGHMSFASSLCGACTGTCPVHIDLHKLLLYNRQEGTARGMSTWKERLGWRLWRRAMLRRQWMNRGSASFKNFIFRKWFSASWGPHREPITFPEKTFNQAWKEQHESS